MVAPGFALRREFWSYGFEIIDAPRGMQVVGPRWLAGVGMGAVLLSAPAG